MASIFGPGVAELQAARQQQDLDTALKLSGSGGTAAFAGFLSGSAAGRGITNLFQTAMGEAAQSDPAMRRAALMDQVKQAFSNGQLELEDVPNAFRAGGDPQAAIVAQAQIDQLVAGAQKARKVTAEAGRAETEALRSQVGLGTDVIKQQTAGFERDIKSSEAKPETLRIARQREAMQLRKAVADATKAELQARGEQFKVANQQAELDREIAANARKIERENFQDAKSFHTNLRSDKAYGLIAGASAGWDQLQVSYGLLANDPEAGGVADLGLVIGLYKIVDPTSTVRETEASLAGARDSVNAKVRAWAKRLAGGGQLTNEERREIWRMGRNNMAVKKARLKKMEREYAKSLPANLDLDAALAPLRVIDPDVPTGKPPLLPVFTKKKASEKQRGTDEEVNFFRGMLETLRGEAKLLGD